MPRLSPEKIGIHPSGRSPGACFSGSSLMIDAATAGLGVVGGPLGPGGGNSSGMSPGSSSGLAGSPGSCIGGGASGCGFPGGSFRGGSVGCPGVAGGISGGSIGIYIATLRSQPMSDRPPVTAAISTWLTTAPRRVPELRIIGQDAQRADAARIVVAHRSFRGRVPCCSGTITMSALRCSRRVNCFMPANGRPLRCCGRRDHARRHHSSWGDNARGRRVGRCRGRLQR
jgi:hypothetical protein